LIIVMSSSLVKLSEKYLHRQYCLLTLWFSIVHFLSHLLPGSSFWQPTF
jgi:hypothetical protein